MSHVSKISAHLEGRNAYVLGKPRKSNPHHYQRVEHEQWDEGWMEAAAEANSNS